MQKLLSLKKQLPAGPAAPKVPTHPSPNLSCRRPAPSLFPPALCAADTAPGLQEEKKAAAAPEEQEEKGEFLVDGKPVFDDQGNRITGKSAYKKYIKEKEKAEKKAANPNIQKQQTASDEAKNSEKKSAYNDFAD